MAHLREFERESSCVQPAQPPTPDAEREKVTVLAQVAESIGYTVRWQGLPRGTASEGDPNAREITMAAALDYRNRVYAFAHGIAHAIMGPRNSAGEIEADAVAYIVARVLGSPVGLSVGYYDPYSVPAGIATNPAVIYVAQEILLRYEAIRTYTGMS